MPLTIGVDITDIRSRTNDINSRIDSGVAGRNMAGELLLSQRDHVVENNSRNVSDYIAIKVAQSGMILVVDGMLKERQWEAATDGGHRGGCDGGQLSKGSFPDL